MKLPQGERAVVDLAKLRNYCLNPEHLRGRHKARVFAARLGLDSGDASRLREALLQAACAEEVVEGHADEHGRRYILDFGMKTLRGGGTIRSIWLVPGPEHPPRLVTCYVR